MDQLKNFYLVGGLVCSAHLGIACGSEQTQAATVTTVPNAEGEDCPEVTFEAAPNLQRFQESKATAIRENSQVDDSKTARTWALDMSACEHTWSLTYLPFGSAFFVMGPVGDSQCEVWLGGETEYPDYDGTPTSYCLLPRCGTFEVQTNTGGPAVASAPGHCLSPPTQPTCEPGFSPVLECTQCGPTDACLRRETLCKPQCDQDTPCEDSSDSCSEQGVCASFGCG